MNHEEFITRWQRSGGAELANSQSFLKELCQLLELPEPEPTLADESQNSKGRQPEQRGRDIVSGAIWPVLATLELPHDPLC